MTELLYKSITDRIIGAAITVHKKLGPGLLESVYETCLAHELLKNDIPFRRQCALPIVYDEITLDGGLRLDLLVDDQVIVEIKAVERILPVHEAQLLTYLKLSNYTAGLLINFNMPRLKDGIMRRVLTQK